MAGLSVILSGSGRAWGYVGSLFVAVWARSVEKAWIRYVRFVEKGPLWAVVGIGPAGAVLTAAVYLGLSTPLSTPDVDNVPAAPAPLVVASATATPTPAILAGSSPLVEAATPAPVEVPAPAPIYAGLDALIAEHFPEAPAFWIAVFRCESVRYRPDVVYGPHVSRTGDRGIAQLNEIHAGRFAARGWDYYAVPRSPAQDLAIAAEIAGESGSRPWSSSAGCWGGR